MHVVPPMEDASDFDRAPESHKLSLRFCFSKCRQILRGRQDDVENVFTVHKGEQEEMLKLKNILPVFVVLLFLGVASTAFAQVSCGVASTPVSRDTTTGLTEPAGDVTFTCTQTGAANTAATITVDYKGIPITNSVAYPGAKPIAVTTVSPAAPACAQPTIASVVNATGQVVISVPASLNGAGPSICSFTLTGVLLGIGASGTTSGSTLLANVSVSPGNNLLITAGQNTPTVVTAVLDAIPSTGFKSTGTAVSLTTGFVVGAGTGTMTVTEGYIDAFRSAAQFNSGASTNGTQFLFTFSGLVTGETLTCTPTANNGNAVVVQPGAAATGTATAAAPTILVEWASAGTTGLTSADTLTMSCAFAAGTATLPLGAGSITATVALSPVGVAFGTGGAVLTSATAGQIPRYTGPTLGPVTVVSIISASTNILFPFVTVGGGFDTGLAVANTGNDPFGTKGQGGPVAVVFYPAGGGTPFCVATAAGAAGTTGGPAVSGITAGCTVMSTVPGSGITSGALAAGSTWAVNASELVKAGGGTSFSGYAFAIANSPVTHGTFFVYLASGGNFAGFSGGPALIVPNIATSGARLLTTEGLGH